MGFAFQEQGVPVLDESRCTSCLRCAEICPTDTLAVEDGRVRVARRSFMGCIGCGHCMMVCGEDAIRVRGRRIDASDLAPLTGRGATFPELDALMLRRRSARRFTPQPVEHDRLVRILSAASCAPMGIPPTEVGVVVVEGREQVQEFASTVVELFRRTERSLGPLMLAFLRPFMRAEEHRALREFVRPLFREIVAARDEGQDVLFYDAPALIVFHSGAGADRADAAIACTYAMLAAEALGLGSCMIGTLGVLDRHPRVARDLGIPEGRKTALGLVIGHSPVVWERGIRRKWASERWSPLAPALGFPA